MKSAFDLGGILGETACLAPRSASLALEGRWKGRSHLAPFASVQEGGGIQPAKKTRAA